MSKAMKITEEDLENLQDIKEDKLVNILLPILTAIELSLLGSVVYMIIAFICCQ